MIRDSISYTSTDLITWQSHAVNGPFSEAVAGYEMGSTFYFISGRGTKDAIIWDRCDELNLSIPKDSSTLISIRQFTGFWVGTINL